MAEWAVSWIGDHVSTVDGRVIQVVQIREFTEEQAARQFVVETAQQPQNCMVRLWHLVEAFPYRYDGTCSIVSEDL